MKAMKLSALLVAGLLGLSACSSTSSGSGSGSTSGDSAGASQLKIAMITHGDGGSFWSVAKKGAEDAAKAMNVNLDYEESNNDPQKQAQLIEAAVTGGAQGIAVSAPNPDAIKDALAKATAAGIPIITLNSGSTVYKELGAITHVGQDEEIAGEGAGEQLKAAGGTNLLCVIHEQNNTGLQDRCTGAAKTFGGKVTDFQVTGTSDPTKTANEIAAKLQADTSIDSVLALNPDIAMAAVESIKTAGSKAKLGDVRPLRRRGQGDRGRHDPLRRRPAAVPPGLPPGGLPCPVQPQCEHRRWRPARPHRPRVRDQGQRRQGSVPRGGRDSLSHVCRRAAESWPPADARTHVAIAPRGERQEKHVHSNPPRTARSAC